MYRIGIDTGGTNTDLVLTNMKTGEVFSTKTPTTTHHVVEGIFSGINKIAQMASIDLDQIKDLIYGTTIVVNMIAQKENEEIALITTKGFKDVVEIGRAWRAQNIYDNFIDQPDALVRRDLRYEVSERINFRGEIYEPLDENELKKIIDNLKQKNVRSVAISLLHSYRNPIHEKRIKELLIEELPEFYISVSSEINSQFREYERTSTTVINAYMMPNMVSHLKEFNEELTKHKLKPTTYMMNSNAGIMGFSSAIEKPVTVSNSGPIGGIIAANYLGMITGEKNLITFDMGGTSCDVALIKDNEISFKTDSRINGYPISIPTVDLEFIGAGGGSIAWYDKGNVLKVGPKSAGAYPGPVCYGRGGNQPTVTDANLVLGRIRPEIFLEEVGTLLEKTKQVINEKIAKPLGLGLNQAAEGIIDVVNANMLRAIKLVSVQRGHHPSDFSLVSFGGAGGLHAAKLAGELNIPKVIVPYSPGTFAAFGQILADIKHDFVYTKLQRAASTDLKELNQIYEQLENEGISQLKNEGIEPKNQVLIRSCDMRYEGQAYELNVKLPSGFLTNDSFRSIIEKFHQMHEKIYGHSLREDNIELVSYRVSAVGLVDKINLGMNVWETGSQVIEKQAGKVIFDGKEYSVPIFNRNQLEPGFEINEPAIIGEMGSTTVIYPGQTAIIDQYRSIVIHTNTNNN